MTADERIEALLNRFGQTIEDLPTARELRSREAYAHLFRAEKSAENWFDPEDLGESYMALLAYICHLTDAIDRMEVALETAARVAACGACEIGNSLEICARPDGMSCFQIADIELHDMDEEHL